MSRGALNTLYGLKDAGFESLLVGGGVRDLLLGLSPKDFDVATNAEPEQVEETFRRCRLVGRRFRLAHVRSGPEIIEVATFRAAPRDLEEIDVDDDNSVDDPDHVLDDSGRILRDNIYGNLEQDAFRRDFTVNALYYDIRDFSVVDYVGGMEDLQARRLRLIGDPATRYREDPVRMLRAVRFASKLDFEIDESAAAPIHELAGLLVDVPPARLFDESLKLFLNPDAERNFDGLRHFGLFQVMFPMVAEALESERGEQAEELIRLALRSTESRVRADKSVTPGFLFAAFFWLPVEMRAQELEGTGMPRSQALAAATDEAMSAQAKRVAIPRRFSGMQADIWHIQPRFEFRRGKRPVRLMENRRFRAAYDFLLLRAQTGDAPQELADWWTRFQEVSAEEQQAMTEAAPAGPKTTAGRRRKRRRR